jgi:methylglutaconyl-CoA hydratase
LEEGRLHYKLDTEILLIGKELKEQFDNFNNIKTMEDITKQGHVTLNIREGIGTITFFHPAHNSLPGKLLAELTDTINKAGQHPEIKVIVLQSEGEKTFCAGASFDELISIKDTEVGHRFFMGFANVINACRKCPKLIIGRIQGKAIGGGVGIASATDYCYAVKSASAKLSELAVGIGPFVVGPVVQRKVGLSAFSQMSINATKFFDAEWAREKGLYAEVFETASQMDDAIAELSFTLANSSPEAMADLKKIFWEGTENWDELLSTRAGISGRLVLTDFTVNAINKFKAKA